jgi:predicted phosphoadenosine phosphosulfate sulfurtransferase
MIKGGIIMGKRWLGIDVYEAAMQRIDYVFQKFDHVVVSFSGGKDSGVMLELVYDYYKKHESKVKVSVFHLDYEGSYQQTLDYVDRCMGKYPEFDYYHICLPVSASCGISMYHTTWMPWNPEEKELWVREIPDKPYVIHLENHSFDFFRVGMSDYQFQVKFGKWLHKEKEAKLTAILVGIRAQESLHRYNAINRKDNFRSFGNTRFTQRIGMNVFNVYPIYDWTTSDIWTANALFKWDYNEIYDLYYKAGIPVNEMRVANPFHHSGVHSLKLYRAIEPKTWAKLVGRVNGANFAAIYGGSRAVGYKTVKLPQGHSWKTYVNFLLKTLPAATRNIYLKKFTASIKYWTETGGALPLNVVDELDNVPVAFEKLGKPQNNRNYRQPYEVIRFKEYPDNLPIKNFRLVPSYKRMCITILKNDTACRYMGFSQTVEELSKQKEALETWKNLF